MYMGNPVIIGMFFIPGTLTIHPQKDEQGSCHTDCEAGYINYGKEPVFGKVSKSQLAVVEDHIVVFSPVRYPTDIFWSDHDIFHNGLTIKHANDTVAVSGIVLRVRYHYDRSALFIQISQ